MNWAELRTWAWENVELTPCLTTSVGYKTTNIHVQLGVSTNMKNDLMTLQEKAKVGHDYRLKGLVPSWTSMHLYLASTAIVVDGEKAKLLASVDGDWSSPVCGHAQAGPNPRRSYQVITPENLTGCSANCGKITSGFPQYCAAIWCENYKTTPCFGRLLHYNLWSNSSLRITITGLQFPSTN